MEEQTDHDIRGIGVEVGTDGKTAVAYELDQTGMVTTLRQEGAIGELPIVKKTARELARRFEATFIPPRTSGPSRS